MVPLRIKITFSLIALFCIAVIISSEIKLPLQNDEKGEQTAQGKITSCELTRVGIGATTFLAVKIQLNHSENKQYSVNTKLNKRTQYQKLCDDLTNVSIVYTASRSLIRPSITYQVNTIEIIR